MEDSSVNLLREVNDRIRQRAARQGGDAPSRFVCECGDPDCVQTIVLPLAAYDARRNSNAAKILAH